MNTPSIVAGPRHGQQQHRDPGRHGLQRRDHLVPGGHQEQHVEQRKRQRHAHARPQQRQHARLQHDHHRQLPRQQKPENRPASTGSTPRRTAAVPATRRKAQAQQPARPQPDQPAEDQRDQQRVVVGRTVPPLQRHVAPIAGEQREHAEPCRGNEQQRPPPAFRHGQNETLD
jgi:hypothetical protein